MSEQAVPMGYKKTEVGVIPEDWDVQSLFALAGKNRERLNDGDWIEAKYLADSGVRLLQTGNIGVGNFVEKEEKKYVSFSTFDALHCKEVRPGDLLICRLAEPAGRACIVPELLEEKMITSVDVTIFRPIPEVADKNYLMQVFCTEYWLAEVRDRCGGSTRSRIARSELGRILVPLPPLPEQRAIAAALGDVDALLTALDALIAKKRAVKQAAMQALLTGRVRLPGFSGEWVTRRLWEVGECLRGVSYKPDTDLFPSDSSLTIRLLRANNIQDDHLDLTDLQFVNAKRVSEKQVLQPNDIVVCMANGSKDLVGKAAFFDLHDGHSYTFGAFMGCFRVSETNYAHPIFVSYLFQTGRYRNAIEVILSGSSINNLKPSDIESIEFLFPPLPEQRAIAAVLADMDAEIAALEARREKVRQVKQGMMQVLLTGKVRLVEPAHQNTTQNGV